MILSYKWLLDYLPLSLPAEELSLMLTNIGLEVEALETVAQKHNLDGLLVGEVLTCIPHPNADKLRLTTVHIGTEQALHIVCGAPNVAAGQKVIVAPVGCILYPAKGESFQIKKAKIRGEASEGMICAEDEIGLGSNHDGIIVLPAQTPVGMKATDYFKLPTPDTAIHIGLTPNRADANSHIGVARDLCAYLSHHRKQAYKPLLPEIIALPTDAPAKVQVHIEAPDACPRYAGICLYGLKVGPSPDWLVSRLATLGLRSINNVVDATNYILHEWGQPLHAFDLSKIAGHQITVRYANPNEKFVSLDAKERVLRSAEDLMICDAKGPIALAGVFGGLHSGVSEETTDIFIESACFDPTIIRRSSLHHGLRTDAALHFEKGVDIARIPTVMMRAASLIQSLAGGQIEKGSVDNYPVVQNLISFPLRYEYINRLAGKNYAPEVVRGILSSLEFQCSDLREEGCMLTVPSYKKDITQMADVVEEVMRIDGLDNIPIPQRLNMSLTKPMPSDRAARNQVTDLLAGMGFSEIVTNSITNGKYYDAQTPVARLLNSLSQELDVMRPSMLETGLEVMSYNLARRNEDLMLFEHGFVYAADFSQRPVLALYACGTAQAAGWRGKAIPANVYFLKSVVEKLIRKTGIQKANLSYEEDVVCWKWKNKTLCQIQELSPDRCRAFGIKERVWYAELDWALWLEALSKQNIQYQEVPRFPAVHRDLALVLDKSVRYADLQRVTDKLKLQHLCDYSLFDVFEGGNLSEGKKSLALRFCFQRNDRTLTDVETEALMTQLSQAYHRDLGAQIRE
ncbi:MAG: phenylalanine--tRNA ligase subunit beta [Bacteroidetes bacterium]|nr:phenylalanine--tRNA ligase subunit beta [Bacteroidota bacterium]